MQNGGSGKSSSKPVLSVPGVVHPLSLLPRDMHASFQLHTRGSSPLVLSQGIMNTLLEVEDHFERGSGVE